jgi:hypothetical protein
MELDLETPLNNIENLFKTMDFKSRPVKPQEPIVNPIITNQPSTSKMLLRAFDTVKNVLGEEFFNITFDGKAINVQDKTSNSEFNYTPILASLVEFMINKGMGVTPLPEIKLKQDLKESLNFFGRTAYYDPSNMEIVLYTQGRHPKDVVRSFAHEMIHHIQNLEGRLQGITTNNTAEDGHLQEIEKEAYLEGNITFRQWEDTIKNP